MTTFNETLKSVPSLPQRQDSTNDQLRDLRAVATRLGMYDAADYIRVVLENSEKRVTVIKVTEVRSSDGGFLGEFVLDAEKLQNDEFKYSYVSHIVYAALVGEPRVTTGQKYSFNDSPRWWDEFQTSSPVTHHIVVEVGY